MKEGRSPFAVDLRGRVGDGGMLSCVQKVQMAESTMELRAGVRWGMSCGRELEELEVELYIVEGEWLIGMCAYSRGTF